MRDKLNTDIQYVKGVGPTRVKYLNKLKIYTVQDILYYFPRTWVDRTNIKNINEVKIGEKETIQGNVIAKETKIINYRLKITQVIIQDNTGFLSAIWYNQPYMEKIFKRGDKVILHGKIEIFRHQLQINNPEYEIITGENENINVNRIVPVYSLTEKLSQKQFRKIIKNIIDSYIENIQEYLPSGIIKKYDLLDLKESLKNIHFPENFDTLEKSKKRLIFDEFFLLQFIYALKNKQIKEKKGIIFNTDGKLYNKFISNLPFELTNAQKKVLEDIKRDFKSGKPMNRLLQGDVGSGKTIIAVISSIIAKENGYQSSIMAPTEILAQQHFNNILNLLKGLDINVALLIGGVKRKERENIINKLKNGEIDIVVGTHALIQEEIEFKNLGFVVIDEQHRFGVLQRSQLIKKGNIPHVLIMTATPIPRTLALTVYGDTDISIIDEMPPGRKLIKTLWFKENEKDKLYSFINERLKEKEQVYVVYPLVQESEKLDLKSAIEMEKEWKKIFSDYNVDIIHGQMKKEERDLVMKKFKNKEIDILVATTVIEVGIDVPNASVMIIEHAERFGLSQLHQLRGRVGRGEKQSYCILIGNPKTEEGIKRLNIMVSTNDGFRISEEDLALRGPGEFLGTRQHGIPEFKIANIIQNKDILEQAKECAFDIVHGKMLLTKEEKLKIFNMAKEKFSERFDLINVS